MKTKDGSPPEGRPAGRPLAFDRTEAITAAMNLFWKDGYTAVSTSDIAAAMGIRRSSFYNSFGSRERVFREALEQYAEIAPDTALDRLPDGASITATIAETLREVCRVRAADPEGRGCLVCNSVADLVGTDPELGPQIEAFVERRARSFSRLLRRAVERGEIAARDDYAAAGRAFVTFQLGLNVLAKVVRNEQMLWRACREFLHGMGFRDLS